jgi:hypothetical protein
VVTLDFTSVLASVTAELGLPDVAAKLPPEASSIEVMKSSELDAAQKGLNLLQKVGYVLTALALLLYGGRDPARRRSPPPDPARRRFLVHLRRRRRPLCPRCGRRPGRRLAERGRIVRCGGQLRL